MSACIEGSLGPPPTYEELKQEVKELRQLEMNQYGAVMSWSSNTPREQLYKRRQELVSAKLDNVMGMLYSHEEMELHVIELCLDVIQLSDILREKSITR